MRKLSPLILFLTYICVLTSCRERQGITNNVVTKTPNDYASLFSIKKNDSAVNVCIFDKSGNKVNFSENFSQKNSLNKVVCMSTGHIAFMKKLGLSDKIAAVSGGNYIYDADIKDKISKGIIADIGYEGSLNYELLVKLDPDIIFTYGIEGENNSYIDKLKKMGFRVVVLGDYLENHPLGKLEYLKLFGAIFNCIDKADSIYTKHRDKYLEISAKISNFTPRKKVLLNAPWKEIWYIPGSENYISVMINDAGGEVLMSRKGESASHPYNIEDVYKEALNADLWLNPNNYHSIDELRDANPLFKSLPVLRRGLVFNNNLRGTEYGGSDFWESGVTEPDVILEELVRIIHPDILGKREIPVYYKELLN